MSFARNIYTSYLPVLKVGHYFDIGGVKYVVTEVRVFPYAKTGLSGTGERYDFNQDTLAEYQVLHGNKDQKRVTQLRYLALGQTTDTYIYWLTNPFTGTKEQKVAISSTYAPTTHPIEFNKWSYSTTMYASAEWASGATQDFIWEVAIYKVEPTTKIPKEYLKITDKGDASFVKG